MVQWVQEAIKGIVLAIVSGGLGAVIGQRKGTDKIKVVRKKIDKRLNDIKDQFNCLEEDVDELQQEVNTIENSLYGSELDNTDQGVVGQIDDLSNKINRIRDTLSNIEGKIDELNGEKT